MLIVPFWKASGSYFGVIQNRKLSSFLSGKSWWSQNICLHQNTKFQNIHWQGEGKKYFSASWEKYHFVSEKHLLISFELLAPWGALYITPPGYRPIHPIHLIPSTYSLRCYIRLRRVIFDKLFCTWNFDKHVFIVGGTFKLGFFY